ncbi:hypothetical protein BH10PSE12_BH10PSE12_22690 [soil metagenome]
MELIDAQIHPMLHGKAFAGLSGEALIDLSADMAIASMDAVGVTGAALSWRDLAMMEGYIARYPGRFVGYATSISVALDGTMRTVITHDDSPEEYVERVSKMPGIVGIRMGLPYGRVIDAYREGVHEPYYVAAEKRDFPIFVTLHHHQKEYEQTIRAHPDLRFIIDHVGLPTPPNAADGSRLAGGPHNFTELEDVLALARYPNVAIKFTAVPSLSAEPYPFSDVWPPMRRMIDTFGIDRMMWGSDFTRCVGLHSYRESVDFLLLTDQLSQEEKTALASGSFRKWVGWPDS